MKKIPHDRIVLSMEDLAEKVGGLQNYGKVINPAMSKTKRKMKSMLSAQIRTLYAIKKGDLDNTIKDPKYTTAPPNISVIVRSSRFTLGRFMTGKSARGKAVRVQVKKGQREMLPSPVFATSMSGRNQIARREGRDRLPIEVLHTISSAQMATNDEVYDETLQGTYSYLMSEIEKQHKRFIEKLNKG